ncbi:MAG: histidine kinase [Bacteroidales bacterium]|jgi:CRISPR/Cas system CSM-associated protein Csm2 small subunit
MKKNIFEEKRIQVLLHLLAWTILLVLPLYFIKRWQIGNDFVWLYYVNTLINGAIFYFNYFLIVPRYFFGNRKYRYYISVVVLLVFFYFVSDKSNNYIFTHFGDRGKNENSIAPTDNDRIHHGPPMRTMHLFNYGFTSVFLVFFSLGLRVLERHSTIEKVQKELEREKLNSELAFLKNQISPHFFFNTLNNIYALISINAEDSRNAVLKLSRMMRYLLYESERGDTKLSNEIEFMNNYIDLMRLRMSDKMSLKVSFPEKYIDYSLPPLLFIPFIENAFKHGISFRERSFIEVSLSSDPDGISFGCLNSSQNGGNNSENEAPGIGLGNVKKRLELLFPGKHKLEINKTATTFEVLLKIDIKV